MDVSTTCGPVSEDDKGRTAKSVPAVVCRDGNGLMNGSVPAVVIRDGNGSENGSVPAAVQGQSDQTN